MGKREEGLPTKGGLQVASRGVKTEAMKDLDLSADFPIPTHDEWASRAEKALKGVSLAKLTRMSRDGIAIKPLYSPGQRPAIAAREGGLAWKVVQRVDMADASQANRQALEDLSQGATGLAIDLARVDASKLDVILKDVALHAIHLRFEGEIDVSDGLMRLCEAQAINPERLDVALSLPSASLAKKMRAQDFTGPLLLADGRKFHNEGASEAQELGFSLAQAIDHLRAMDGDAAAVHFALSASPDMFLTLAKFRAARLLWARVLEASGLAPSPLHLHGETSLWHMSLTDAHVNMLRAVAGVFGAGLGGADSQSVLPFTYLTGEADDFARRMARNAQIILLEESHLHAVQDPAAGSGYMEALSLELCEKAWGLMQQAEKQADVKALIAASAQAQIEQVAKRALALTGTSEFPNLADDVPEDHGPLRLATAFEALRRRAQKAKPEVRLINLGRLADHSARSLWTQNLLAAGGIRVGSEASSVVVLCGSDETYETQAAEVIAKLQGEGVEHIWIAGKFTAQGAERFYAGMNVIELLERMHQQLGVGR